MSAIRDEIRAILREELAALRGELAPTSETVRISSTADLSAFAQDLLLRASDPNFVAQVANGSARFVLAGTPIAMEQHTSKPIVTSPPKPAGITIDKALLTERDISKLDTTARFVRVSKRCRLTPLASDEARRRGIRIERIEV
jgi:hypothetical protein